MFELKNQERYEKLFQNHVTVLTRMDGLQIISFAALNTKYYSAEFILKDNHIFVSGDLGYAVFSTTWKPTWDYPWDKTELGYFTEKIKAFDAEKYVIDLEKAEKEVKEWIIEADDWENPEEIADELVSQAYWENIFEDIENKEIFKKDNSSHLLKISYKLLTALYNADNYAEYNNSLKTLFDSEEWECLYDLPYDNLGAEINPKIEMWLYILREAKKQILSGKICK